MTLYAEILPFLPVDRCFSYIVPEEYIDKAKIGKRVLVPFSRRELTGVIIKLQKKAFVEDVKLKEIHEILDETPVFSSDYLSFTKKLSEYYFTPWGELLHASLPSSLVLGSQKRVFITSEGLDALTHKELTKIEKEVLTLVQKKSYSIFFLRKKLKSANFSYIIDRLKGKGWIETKEAMRKKGGKKKEPDPKAPTQLEMDFTYDEDIARTISCINEKLEERTFLPFYLFGPANKRAAVYFHLMKTVLSLKKRVLFLVPEIVMTESFLEDIEKKMGQEVAVFHSRLSERKKGIEWWKVKEGDVRVLVGTRSALLTPVDSLGLIIVDEEHDDSYYQPETPSYDARKGAWFRAEQDSAILIYGSSVPTIDAFYTAKQKGYLLDLYREPKKWRAEIVEDRPRKQIISQKLKRKITQKLIQKEPILIFYNRRGYASFLYCAKCQYIPRCSRCDIALSYHKREERLTCRYCNKSIPKIHRCPQCGSSIILKKGLGIQAIEEELKNMFPQNRIACFDSDIIRSKSELERIILSFSKEKIDVLLGTQFLAHQRNLPLVSMVVILYPETTLTLPDYRANQKTFQNIYMMEKYLRNESQSELIIQTALPQHFSIRYAAVEDYLSYYRQEIKFRRIMNYPPFSHMVEILLQGKNQRALARASRRFLSFIKSKHSEVEILGPSFAGIQKIRGQNRIQIVLKAKKKKILEKILRESLKEIKVKKSVQVY